MKALSQVPRRDSSQTEERDEEPIPLATTLTTVPLALEHKASRYSRGAESKKPTDYCDYDIIIIIAIE